MKMSAFTRGMIFLTFIGSCFAISLLIASLGTKEWINSTAKRTSNPHESEGKINFGLFDGKKELNVAYGWRTYDIDVLYLLKHEPEFLIYGFWIGTVTCICAGILFSGLSAIFAAVNTAITTKNCIAKSSSLYIWNTIALLAELGAIGFWIAQYYLRLEYNVLSREDRDNMWTSDGMAVLGYSFWFVVGGAAVTFIDIIILIIANSEKEVDHIIPMLEEKTNGAIMLY